MATSELITELVRAHAAGDERRWQNLLLQLIAAETRAGHGRQAARLRELHTEAKLAANDRSHTAVAKPIQLARAPQDLADILAVRYSDTHLSDLVLDQQLSRRLRRVLDEQRMADRLTTRGLQPRRRLLFHGPPGCGKTFAAEAIAGELSLPLARVRLEVLFSRYLGQTAATLVDIFDQIRKVRAVYLFDEFDALGRQRSDESDIGEAKRVVGTFLQLLDADESSSIVIAATNIATALDRALLRRFDDVIEFPPPSDETTAQLLRRVLRGLKLKTSDLNRLIDQARGMSFADIRAAVDDARKFAIIADDAEPSVEDVATALTTRNYGSSL